MTTTPGARTTPVRRSCLAVSVMALVLAGCTSTTSGSDEDNARRSTPRADASAAPTGAPASSAPSGPGDAGTVTVTASATATASGGTSVPSRPLRTVTTTGPDRTGHVVQVWAERRDKTCADHAYGKPVTAFLTEHPCNGMDRILATTTVDGRPVGISEITTSFPGTAANPYARSTAFSTLVRKDGTGSIDDLLREGYRLPSGPTQVPTPDAFDCLGQDNGVSIYDLWYLDGPTPDNAKALVTLAEDIFLQV